MRFRKTIEVEKSILDTINRYLLPHDTMAETQDEDDTISVTVTFDNGYQADIKCCGVQFEEGEPQSNTSWTEAVLFTPEGFEVNFTDVSDEFLGEWHLSDRDGNEYVAIVREKGAMKHYIDIQNLRPEDVELGSTTVYTNRYGFVPGDIIAITEKIDGSNGSFRYDAETGKIHAWSRRMELSEKDDLKGFYQWTQSLDPNVFADVPNYIFFGEWLRKNAITYESENMHKFYAFDVWDVDHSIWLDPERAREIAEAHGLTWVHELYHGPFISWEHIWENFSRDPFYGDTQEGVIVKNVTSMQTDRCYLCTNKEIYPEFVPYEPRSADELPLVQYPFVLKLVNAEFAETQERKRKSKIVDPEILAAQELAEGIAEQVIQPMRVRKMLTKLAEDGIIPDELTPADMRTIAQNLPKRIWEDLQKEEPERLLEAGEFAGKAVNARTMVLARELILGKTQ